MKLFYASAFCCVLTACSTTVNLPEVPVYHPAHAEAMTSQPPGPPSVMMAASPPVADPGLPVSDMAAHADHDAATDAAEATNTHVHKTEVSTATTHPDAGDQPMPGERGVVYACQVHPDAASRAPGQCPRCGLPLTAQTMHMQHGDNHDGMQHDAEPHAVHSEMEQGDATQQQVSMQMPDARQAIADAGLPLYACPHHPEIISSFAGPTCPKCGMSLELVEDAAE